LWVRHRLPDTAIWKVLEQPTLDREMAAVPNEDARSRPPAFTKTAMLGRQRSGEVGLFGIFVDHEVQGVRRCVEVCSVRMALGCKNTVWLEDSDIALYRRLRTPTLR
jgi:hypothetical protein